MLADSVCNVVNKSLKELWSDPQYTIFLWTDRNVQYPSYVDYRQADSFIMDQTNEVDWWWSKKPILVCYIINL